MSRRTKYAIVLGVVALLAWWGLSGVCWSARLRYGISVPECPDGRPRQTVHVQAANLRRGGQGSVAISALAHYTLGPADHARASLVRRGSARLVLLVNGKELPLEPAGGWREVGSSGSSGSSYRGEVALPADVPDGDWTLRASVSTPLGESKHELALPLYAPARIHVLADRPLYRPGDTMRFRALALRARDLAPLEQRRGASWSSTRRARRCWKRRRWRARGAWPRAASRSTPAPRRARGRSAGPRAAPATRWPSASSRSACRA